MKAATDPNAIAVAPNAARHLRCLDVLSVISLKVSYPLAGAAQDLLNRLSELVET